jgi:hypothetical protein
MGVATGPAAKEDDALRIRLLDDYSGRAGDKFDLILGFIISLAGGAVKSRTQTSRA